MNWATSAAVVEQTLRRRPGALAVEANAVSQTASVTYDPDRTDVAQLSRGFTTVAPTEPGRPYQQGWATSL